MGYTNVGPNSFTRQLMTGKHEAKHRFCMHILLTFPLALGIPGGGPYAYAQTARHLHDRGARVTLLPVQSIRLGVFPRPPVTPDTSGAAQITELKELGINVLTVPANPLHFVFDGLNVRREVARLLHRERVDAVISWHHEAAFLSKLCREHKTLLAQRAAGSYRMIRSSPHGAVSYFLLMLLLKRAFRSADAVWATSAFTGREVTTMFSLPLEKVSVIPEGVNPLFMTARRKRDENESISRFFYFGALSKQKGLMDALAAMGTVSRQGYRDWQFRIAGWGDEDLVWRAAEEHDISNRIQILGPLDHPSLLKRLEWAQVVLLPSTAEAFGLAVVEALASGAPVIAYTAGAVPEKVQHLVSGWLVPLNRVDLLAAAVVDAMRDPAQTYRMGLAGREFVAAVYSWERTADEMLTQIERVKAAGNPHSFR